MDNERWSRLSPEQQAEAWRQHAAQQGPPPGFQAPPPQGAASVPPKRRPFYKKKRYMIPLTLVVLLIAVLSINGNSGGVDVATVTPTGPPHAVSARDWQLIAKDPDSHKGESIIVYGEVIQFDAATGTSGLRAEVDGVEHPLQSGFADYSTNTVIAGDPAVLKNVVEKDVFKASVTVAGSTSYDTQIGGHTTAPTLQIQSIQVTGHAG
ncbi:hypothetical protein [Pseudonocardia sp.]|uniref:hypothetical protein n=1 Tax=Pseudonocardia sp. TaxID=60912 RepID=UPI00260F8B81|nr:hypothetical protein [Pseudonocardia sp.]